MHFLYYLVITLFIFLSILLCGVILIQENRSMGLGASFGGDAGTSLFGTSTADVVKKITAYLAAFFLIGCVVLSLWTSALGRAKMPQVDKTTEEQLEL